MNNEAAPAIMGPPAAVWSGSELVVWGGLGCTAAGVCGDGGLYDPSADAWRAFPATGAPKARASHTVVWTGSSVFIWGGEGCEGFNTACTDGALFVPTTSTWSPVGTTGAPSPRAQTTGVWTGSKVIVWGGRRAPLTAGADITRLDDGAAYDPLTGQWHPLASRNAPAPRSQHTALWTGSRFLVWGGTTNDGKSSGGIYDPEVDQWSAIQTQGAPETRWQHTAVWSGKEMLVWGGLCGDGVPRYCDDGAAYNPATDQWRALAKDGAPLHLAGHSVVWSGRWMIVWGGDTREVGTAYDPDTDSWHPIAQTGAPAPRAGQVAVWTGSEMVVWGGMVGNETYVFDGGRFAL